MLLLLLLLLLLLQHGASVQLGLHLTLSSAIVRVLAERDGVDRDKVDGRVELRRQRLREHTSEQVEEVACQPVSKKNCPSRSENEMKNMSTVPAQQKGAAQRLDALIAVIEPELRKQADAPKGHVEQPKVDAGLLRRRVDAVTKRLMSERVVSNRGKANARKEKQNGAETTQTIRTSLSTRRRSIPRRAGRPPTAARTRTPSTVCVLCDSRLGVTWIAAYFSFCSCCLSFPFPVFCCTSSYFATVCRTM